MSVHRLIEVVWGQRYSVGHREIDRQHQVLFAIINRAKRLFMAGEPGGEQAGVVDDLVKYVVQHFRFEEELMARSGYAGGDDHRAAHQAITAKLLAFRTRHQADGQGQDELADFLATWVAHHISDHDRRLAAHLVQQGMLL